MTVANKKCAHPLFGVYVLYQPKIFTFAYVNYNTYR